MFFLRNCQKLHDGGSMHEKRFGRPVDKHYQAWQRLTPKNMYEIYIISSGTILLTRFASFATILILKGVFFLRSCQKLHDGGSMHGKRFGRPVDKHYQAWQRLIPKNMCEIYI